MVNGSSQVKTGRFGAPTQRFIRREERRVGSQQGKRFGRRSQPQLTRQQQSRVLERRAKSAQQSSSLRQLGSRADIIRREISDIRADIDQPRSGRGISPSDLRKRLAAISGRTTELRTIEQSIRDIRGGTPLDPADVIEQARRVGGSEEQFRARQLKSERAGEKRTDLERSLTRELGSAEAKKILATGKITTKQAQQLSPATRAALQIKEAKGQELPEGAIGTGSRGGFLFPDDSAPGGTVEKFGVGTKPSGKTLFEEIAPLDDGGVSLEVRNVVSAADNTLSAFTEDRNPLTASIEFGVEKIRGLLADIDEETGGQSLFTGKTGETVSTGAQIGVFFVPVLGQALAFGAGVGQFTDGGISEAQRIGVELEKSIGLDSDLGTAGVFLLAGFGAVAGGKSVIGTIEKGLGKPTFSARFIGRQATIEGSKDFQTIVSKSEVLVTRKGLLSTKEFRVGLETEVRIKDLGKGLSDFKAGTRGAIREIESIDLITKSPVISEPRRFGTLALGDIQKIEGEIITSRGFGLTVSRKLEDAFIIKSASRTAIEGKSITAKALGLGGKKIDALDVGVSLRLDKNIIGLVGRGRVISRRTLRPDTLSRSGSLEQLGVTKLEKTLSKDIFFIPKPSIIKTPKFNFRSFGKKGSLRLDTPSLTPSIKTPKFNFKSDIGQLGTPTALGLEKSLTLSSAVSAARGLDKLDSITLTSRIAGSALKSIATPKSILNTRIKFDTIGRLDTRTKSITTPKLNIKSLTRQSTRQLTRTKLGEIGKLTLKGIKTPTTITIPKIPIIKIPGILPTRRKKVKAVRISTTRRKRKEEPLFLISDITGRASGLTTRVSRSGKGIGITPAQFQKLVVRGTPIFK